MSLNFNVDPYYDDFDPSKNFHRVLFKPGSAVQARELTQSQSILQNQISNFADHIFSQNTPVSGGKVTTNLNCFYIKLQPQYENVDINPLDFLNKEITDSTGTVRAKVVAFKDGSLVEPPTLIINYYSGAQFSDGMTIFCVDGSNFLALTIGETGGTTCTGKSSTASISQGIFYVVNGYSNSSTPNPDGSYSKYSVGNFVSVLPQTTVLDKYSNVPSYRVGLLITESIVTYLGDTSLLDPAVGASNYQAPGADRYQITLDLVTRPLTLGDDDAFIELLRLENGVITKQVDGTVYAVIDDYFAKRDFESNGDYIVNDFKLTPSANTSDDAKFNINVGKGVAYVHGYRIENQSDLLLSNDRSRATNKITGNPVFFDYGSYFNVYNLKGKFDVSIMPKIDLHLVSNGSIQTTNTTSYNSTLVGSGYIRNLQYISSTTDANTLSYVYRAYVSDIVTTTLKGSASTGSASTIQFSDTNGKFSNVSNAYYGTTISITGGASVGDRRRIVSYNGATKTATVDQPFTISTDSTSKFSLVFKTGDVEGIVVKNGNYTFTTSAQIDNSSKLNGIATGDTILTNPNNPELIFAIGYPYVANISNSDYNSTRVFRSKSFTNVGGTSTLAITIPAGTPELFLGTGALSADVVKENYTVIDQSTGRILDFCTSGNTVTVSSDKKTVTFASTTYSNPTVDVIVDISISNADNTTTILKAKNLLVGNTTSASISGVSNTINSLTYIDLTKGQVYIKHAGIKKTNSLYVSDVKKIVKVIDSKNPSVDVTSSMMVDPVYDITSLFVLDNGQRDNFYDHANVNLVPGASVPAGNILIVFDYYSHTGGDGYFNINSYLAPVSTSPEEYQNVPTYTAKNGKVYRLSDCVDFRPVRKSAQSAMVFEYTGNPNNDDTGILIPQNLTEYQSDYSYYLARKDKLVLTKDKSFAIIQGTPSTEPIYPTEPDGSLLLAKLSLDPYTAYIPGEAPGQINANLSIEKVLHKNWIKSDITDLQTRVNNLEYYSSLSLLETNAQSLQVPDVNGLNRFKNGILVDDFSSYSTADTANPDFQSNLNTRKKRLGPLNIVDNFALQNPIVLGSLGTLKKTNYFSVSTIGGSHTNVFTLPYTTANLVVQPIATSTVSVNPFAVGIAEGVLSLNPPMDNWVDNNQAPSILIADPSLKIYQQTAGVNILNSGDFATIPGTSSSTTTTTGPVEGHGINPSPFGFVGYIATTTETYASQLGNITSAGYSQVSSTVGSNNGYLTNIAVLPYIRPQQIIFRAKGLLVNAPITATFDGQIVNKYITSPNTIELKNVVGTFKNDDIVGFYTANKFYPTGRVVGKYVYPNTTNVRLYIASLLGAPSYTTTTVVQNAIFNSAGNYSSSTASGTLNNTGAVSALHNSGVITGVGGSYTPVGGSASQIYKVQDANDWGTFLNQYGVWGDINRSASYNASFTVNVAKTGIYTFVGSASSSAAIKVDGNTILSVSNPRTTTSASVSLTAGNHTFSWIATNPVNTPGAVAVVAKDAAGVIIYQSTVPPSSSYDGVTQQIVMPKGGAWFSGVTKVKLDSKASSIDNYYTGASISVQSTYVYSFVTETATYVPPPAPARYTGVNGCFTKDTLVLMADGTEKVISDVKIGDIVFNHNKKMLNIVTMVEEMKETSTLELYSPNKKMKPFATMNHPIYIDGELASPIANEVSEMYPWLGKIQPMENVTKGFGKKGTVYNLWVDGDGTYTVNGYGTTSIVGDGGVLSIAVERGILTPRKASLILNKGDNDVQYGSYLLNKYLSRFNNKFIINLILPTKPLTQKIMMSVFKNIGRIARRIANK